MSAASARPPAFACHDAAGRLEPVRLGVRFVHDAAPGRREDGSVVALAFGEVALRPGSQRVGPFLLHLAVDAEGDGARFDLSVRNASATPAHVEALVLGLRWTGPPSGALRFLRQGWQSWSPAGSAALDPAGEPALASGAGWRGIVRGVGEPPADRAGWSESDLVSVVGVAPSGPCCLAGVLERGVSTGIVYLRRDGDAVRVEVELRLEQRLDPGEERSVEPVRVALGTDVSRLLERYAEEYGEEVGARTTSPFVAGWSSAYHFFHDVTEADFLRSLDALSRLRAELPIDVVQLDAGWERAAGDWLETNEKFPRGLAPLAAAVREAGFRPGLSTAPFLVARESRLFAEHPDWLLRCGDGPLPGARGLPWLRHDESYVLDASREEVRSHLLRSYAALAGLGFSYLKLDFLYAAALQAVAHDPRRTRAERLRLGLEAIRQGAGEEAFLLGCGCPLGPAVGVVDGMRIGPDVAPHWSPAGRHAPGTEAASPATHNAVRNGMTRAWMHRRLWLNDPGCLLARSSETQLDDHERKTLASVIAASGGMAVLSDDLDLLTPGDVARARETLALAREVDGGGSRGTARAGELLAAEIPESLVGRTATGALLALVNASDEPRECVASLASLGLEGVEAVRDPLLRTASARASGKEVRAVLGAHQSALVRLRGEPALAVFCDFDGTFAVQDVGSTLARRYAAERRTALWERLARGELRAWEYNMELLDGLPLSEEKLDNFLRSVELSPGAAELVAWCQQRGLPFRVLSDGFDRNLDRLQELHGVRFEYDANRLWYEDGVWRIAAGHPDPECDCGTGVCKRARIRAFRAAHPGAVVVHVGNGRVSDLCAALASDVVFAKDTLAEELESRGVGFEAFETLRDVLAGLERLEARLLARDPEPA